MLFPESTMLPHKYSFFLIAKLKTKEGWDGLVAIVEVV